MPFRAAAAALWLLVGCAALPGDVPPTGAPSADATGSVVRVVDGDTIHVRLGGARRLKVRLIGIDTPEPQERACFAEEASARARELLSDERVRLVFDRDRTDRYGRTLAYVYRARDDLFVNLVLVRDGYARTLRIEPNTAHALAFAAAESQARSSGRGLWAACR